VAPLPAVVRELVVDAAPAAEHPVLVLLMRAVRLAQPVELLLADAVLVVARLLLRAPRLPQVVELAPDVVRSDRGLARRRATRCSSSAPTASSC
jgi:hypothetical protein